MLDKLRKESAKYQNQNQEIIEGTEQMVKKSQQVKINDENLSLLVDDIQSIYKSNETHEICQSYQDNCNHSLIKQLKKIEHQVFAVFLIDSMNFCFWVQEDFEQEDLVKRLCDQLITNIDSLENSSGGMISSMVSQIFPQESPQVKPEKIDQLNNQRVGNAKTVFSWFKHCNFKFAQSTLFQADGANDFLNKLLKSPMGSCFTDNSKCEDMNQIQLKRAQILLADIQYAFIDNNGFKNKNIFGGIESLTCFADQRLPQLLNSLDVLKQSDDLQKLIDHGEIIDKNSDQELEIRSQTIYVVEKIKTQLVERQELSLMSIKIDNYLWQRGENNLKTLKKHHRVITSCY